MTEAQYFQQGIAELQAGRTAEALAIFQQAVASNVATPRCWLGLSLAALTQGDVPEAEKGVDAVLAAEPHNMRALIIKGDILLGKDDFQNASSYYNLILRLATNLTDIPPQLASDLDRVETRLQQLGQMFQQHLFDRLSSAGYRRNQASARFNNSLDMLLGRKQRQDPGLKFPQSPHAFYLDDVPYCTYFPIEQLPWMADLEAHTDLIESELNALLGQSSEQFSPYVHSGLEQPQNSGTTLLDSDDWTSAFLWQDGIQQSEVLASCPETAALMADLPLTMIGGLAPSVLFSKLDAGAKIDPHTGLLNCRLICHLPLTVPEGCGLRVGEDSRETQRGRSWAFDDSVSHEAWNNGDEPRTILLFDVWRPELDSDERHLITSVLEAVSGFGKVSQSAG
jgi:aspartate beta-hydroxylase